ncbi:hypothetical protein EBR21_00165 [bacterium]|nr:hypothetical protein [bacterium]
MADIERTKTKFKREVAKACLSFEARLCRFFCFCSAVGLFASPPSALVWRKGLHAPEKDSAVDASIIA